MSEQKDIWDKLEIAGKLALPVVIAGATIWFNSQISQRQQNADMVSIAVSVLGQEGESKDDPLRSWAVKLLQHHGGLSADAANELIGRPDRTLISIPGIGDVDELRAVIAETSELTFQPLVGRGIIDLNNPEANDPASVLESLEIIRRRIESLESKQD